MRHGLFDTLTMATDGRNISSLKGSVDFWSAQNRTSNEARARRTYQYGL